MNDILLHYFFISCGGQKKTVLLTDTDTDYENIKELIVDGKIAASKFCDTLKGNFGVWIREIVQSHYHTLLCI